MNTLRKALPLAALCGIMASSACILRSTEQYTTDVRDVLEDRSSKIRTCYDAQLATDPGVSGDVVVNFKVAKKTGVISDVTVDPSSTAPEPLSNCVANSLDGLSLDPGDMAPAQATYTWRFKAG